MTRRPPFQRKTVPARNMVRRLSSGPLDRDWPRFAKALDSTTCQGFAWIADPITDDIRSAATKSMSFSAIVRQMAFLLAVAGTDTKQREQIRADFLNMFDRYSKELSAGK